MIGALPPLPLHAGRLPRRAVVLSPEARLPVLRPVLAPRPVAASCRAGSCRAGSCRAASCRAASCRAASCRAASCRAASCRAASCRAASCRAASCRAASCRAASCRAASLRAASTRAASVVQPRYAQLRSRSLDTRSLGTRSLDSRSLDTRSLDTRSFDSCSFDRAASIRAASIRAASIRAASIRAASTRAASVRAASVVQPRCVQPRRVRPRRAASSRSLLRGVRPPAVPPPSRAPPRLLFLPLPLLLGWISLGRFSDSRRRLLVDWSRCCITSIWKRRHRDLRDGGGHGPRGLVGPLQCDHMPERGAAAALCHRNDRRAKAPSQRPHRSRRLSPDWCPSSVWRLPLNSLPAPSLLQTTAGSAHGTLMPSELAHAQQASRPTPAATAPQPV